MIQRILNSLILTATVLLCGCTQDTTLKSAGSQLDFSQMEEVTLGGIATASTGQTPEAAQAAQTSEAGRNPQAPQTKEAPSTGAGEVVTTPMEIGKTFRLYAFPKGMTDMDKLIATRTYTIKDAAGNPVPDDGQDKLFLPMGEIDIFLVGPLKHDRNEGKRDENDNPLPPDIIDIATPYGVYPHYGADLVSSRTMITVKPGLNQFQATPLHHRMAQTEVVVYRPIDANYTDLNVMSVSIMNQTLTGQFVFNDTGGLITPADAGTETLSPPVRTIMAGQEFRATMYAIPRKKTQLRIGVALSCKLADTGASIERRMESGIMKEDLVAGIMNRFTTKPYLSTRLIFRLNLLPWNDESAANIDVPTFKNQLFSYSGLDAPIEIDGKMYVPDRSGNNRHGELVGDLRYNAQGKYYYAASKNAYIKVPELGHVPVYTLEMTASSQRHTYTLPVWFSGAGAERTLGVHLPWNDNKIYFDSGNITTNRLSIDYNNKDLALMNHLAVYAFTRDASNQLYIHRNGVELATKPGVAHNGLMTDNRLIFWEQTTKQDFRMYAARMTTDANTAALKDNYRNDIANFVGITTDKEDTKRDYIEEGLILDLRGTNDYIRVNGKYAWPDVSRAQNHAVVMSSTLPLYSSTDKSYYFYGASYQQYMQLLHTLGRMQDFTVEVVAKAYLGNATLLNFASNRQAGDNYREFFIHLSWKTNNQDEMHCASPYNDFLGRKAMYVHQNMRNLAYSVDHQVKNPNQWSITRYNEAGRSHIDTWLNGVAQGRASVPETRLFEMRYGFIGNNGPPPFTGWNNQFFNSSIYAIRVYSRQLTEMERQHNYLTDKMKYNIVKQ